MTMLEKLSALFQAHPNQWLDADRLMAVAGRMAWRTRTAELRRPPFDMTIENRQRKELNVLGEPYTVSEYAYRPKTGVYGCSCAALGPEAPCGWCDGPDRGED